MYVQSKCLTVLNLPLSYRNLDLVFLGCPYGKYIYFM